MCLAIFTELDSFRSPLFAPLSQLQARRFIFCIGSSASELEYAYFNDFMK